jgi:membrane-bound metal-dependent hydrolase YbcI (DUF457 family)
MNVLTHGLASLALVRAAWPRAPKQIWLFAAAAGVAADVDLASAWFGAAAWTTWHRTYTHSLALSLMVAVLFAAGYRLTSENCLREKFSVSAAFALAFAAGLLHLAMDACGWEGAALLWPFSARSFAMDWVVEFDPFIVAVILGALLFPELLHLVSSEIGARETRPRGRVGALIGFSIMALYLAMRADFHGNAVALMDARTFRGEVAKRVGAFPESLSPLTWHGIVETEHALHLLTVTEGAAASFDSERAETLFKPEPSAALDAAVKTAAAQKFLRVARFPKATVETTTPGTRVELRDLRYSAVGDAGHAIVVVILLDATNGVLSEQIVWAVQSGPE